MAEDIEKIRQHVLWSVGYMLQELVNKASKYEEMQQRGFGFRKTWASLRLAQLRPKIFWWGEIKSSIESGESSRAMPALERLIQHHQKSEFILTWIAPLSRAYWDMGIGFFVKGLVSMEIKEANILREHYRQQAA